MDNREIAMNLTLKAMELKAVNLKLETNGNPNTLKENSNGFNADEISKFFNKIFDSLN